MKRCAAWVLALLALPACDDSWDGWEEDQELWIHNEGDEAVMVSVDVEGGDADGFTSTRLEAGASYIKDYEGAWEVEVSVARVRDGALLFSADFDEEDFDDDGGIIEIRVHP